jgi:hypothetical protein
LPYTLGYLVDQAYGLIPEEIDLMWRTAPHVHSAVRDVVMQVLPLNPQWIPSQSPATSFSPWSNSIPVAWGGLVAQLREHRARVSV